MRALETPGTRIFFLSNNVRRYRLRSSRRGASSAKSSGDAEAAEHPPLPPLLLIPGVEKTLMQKFASAKSSVRSVHDAPSAL